jgi:hypothetical protein
MASRGSEDLMLEALRVLRSALSANAAVSAR